MKIKSHLIMRNKHNYFYSVILLAFFSSCATFNLQKADQAEQKYPIEKTLEHRFYLIGDAGNSPIGEEAIALKALKNQLQDAPEQSTVLFLGDNIYPSGLPKEGHANRKFAEHQLDVQINAVKNFKGRTIFIPGNHDWYSGISGLNRQENYIEDRLGKDSFLPEKACPLEVVEMNDNLTLIIIDSKWYVSDWSKHPTFNDECDIKTRALFFDELDSEIKAARGKTTLIVMHHPMFTDGPHDGQHSFGSHIKPLPVLGTAKNVIRRTSGIIPEDMQYKYYQELRERVLTLADNNDKVVFVSGHDHSLGYITRNGFRQIISGSGSKTSAVRKREGTQFAYGANGLAVLDVFTDGSSFVKFVEAETNATVFQAEVLPKDKTPKLVQEDNFPAYVSASIYPEEATNKSGFYRWLWGDRYRDAYSKKINAKTVNLDTLYGGLTPTRAGGGNQSNTLRLVDSKGREYVMRALKKDALRYLQAVAFKNTSITGEFDGTYTENLILDVFTASHPYAPFTIASLSDAIDVMHTTPVLFYIPKQSALGEFNSDFGDELYMVEERTSDGHGDKKNFGFANEMRSTMSMLERLRKDEKYNIDESAYIRARLFDMLIGDWDRHDDQWRWAEFEVNDDKIVYRPVPRDRDQVFSLMSDGFVLGLATTFVPSTRLLLKFDEEMKSPKWFNLEPYPLDVALIQKSEKEVWDREVAFIKSHINEAVIDEAFKHFPDEVNKETVNEIKRVLLARLQALGTMSDAYFEIVNKTAVVQGTDKDDWVDIERLPNGKTKVTAYRIKDGKKADVFHERIYDKAHTKQLWIYGLDDDDVFKVYGNGDSPIKINIIGGQNNDIYTIENPKRLTVYDYKTKPNTFETKKGHVILTDDYDTQVYDFRKPRYNANQILPSIGYNPDDGVKVGLVDTYTTYKFKRNPFTSRHTLSAAYFFATEGFDINYSGEFANLIGKWNFGLDARFSSPNFAINFFGFGNTTFNPEYENGDSFDLDFNRVKISNLSFAPSLIYRGHLNSQFKIGLQYESVEIENTRGRFINLVSGSLLSPITVPTEAHLDYLTGRLSYVFLNQDNAAFPTLGFKFGLDAGYTQSLENSEGFGFIIPELALDYKLESTGKLVWSTTFKGRLNLGDDFQFFQAASIGGNNGLRGFRNERFTGKQSFYNNNDLKFKIGKLRTGLIPLEVAIFGGFDYGRVWVDNDRVFSPNLNQDQWHTSYGGGLMFIGVNSVSGKVSLFTGDEGLRVAAGFGFDF